MTGSDVVDGLLEATVVGSFTSFGYGVRRRLGGWSDDDLDLDGRRVLLTGGTSGVGRAAATEMARRGAHVTITGRNLERTEQAARDISAEAAGRGVVTGVACDLASLDQTRALATRLIADDEGLDVLVHNAGALDAAFGATVDGIETTFQVHVVAPALLTHELLPLLRRSADGRVIWVTSGGMYSERLDVDTVELGVEGYDGTKAYARAKRAQVELVPRYAERLGATVSVNAMHPGWADTPGVETSLPRFHTLLGPVLRTPAQGADTVVWLAGAPTGEIGSGKLWLDRKERSRHKGPWTKVTDPEAEVDRLWALVAERAGLDDLVD